jgi:hypothetical protein
MNGKLLDNINRVSSNIKSDWPEKLAKMSITLYNLHIKTQKGFQR